MKQSKGLSSEGYNESSDPKTGFITIESKGEQVLEKSLKNVDELEAKKLQLLQALNKRKI